MTPADFIAEALGLHLNLLGDLASELGVDTEVLIAACYENGAQAIECDWEDEWPTRGPRKRHGWRVHDVAGALGFDAEALHQVCKSLGIMFVQGGDRRAGSSSFFR